MRLILICAVVALAALLAALVVLRRGGGRSSDLVAGQMRAVADPRAAGPAASGLTTLDATVRRQVEDLAASGARLRAINLLRESTGWSLGQAKAAVDRLTGTPGSAPPPVASPGPGPARPGPGARSGGRFPPGFDIDPRSRRHRPKQGRNGRSGPGGD